MLTCKLRQGNKTFAPHEISKKSSSRDFCGGHKYFKTYLKLENHLTNCAVLFLLNLMSGKYIFKMAEDG